MPSGTRLAMAVRRGVGVVHPCLDLGRVRVRDRVRVRVRVRVRGRVRVRVRVRVKVGSRSGLGLGLGLGPGAHRVPAAHLWRQLRLRRVRARVRVRLGALCRARVRDGTSFGLESGCRLGFGPDAACAFRSASWTDTSDAEGERS